MSYSKEGELEGLKEFLLSDADYTEVIRRLIRDAVDAEREACAQIADEHEVCNRYCHVYVPGDSEYGCHWNIAKAIRARGEA